jgi:hypothetical protein
MLLRRWLDAADVRLLWADGGWGEPVAGGREVDRVRRLLRRRTTRARRSADELHDKRLRRGSAPRPARAEHAGHRAHAR